VLSILEDKHHLTFYGFYLRFLEFSVGYIKALKKVPNSVKIVLNCLLNVSFITIYFI